MKDAAIDSGEYRAAESLDAVASLSIEPTIAELATACTDLRDAASKVIASSRIADAIARAVNLWRDRQYPRRADAVARIAQNAGFSVPSMNDSIDALVRPFTRAALEALAHRAPHRAGGNSSAQYGFIMAGNVAGAGMHEVAIALIAGASLLIKTASAEPIFFTEFARTLAKIDPEVGSRITVLNWSRERSDLTAIITAKCDRIVAYGDDATLSSLAHGVKLIGFGSRVSGAVIAASTIAPSQIDAIADALARDVTRFEQLGCLSPHHIFVMTPSSEVAREFAHRMSLALDRRSQSMPPARIPLSDAAKILSVRENARWRRIAGDAIQVWEAARLEWTVIFDPAASFSVSPGFRTVFVSAARDWTDLRARLVPVAGLLEAIAFAGDQADRAYFGGLVRDLGVSYIAAPGEMQSPPLDWPHGNGAFLDPMIGTR